MAEPVLTEQELDLILSYESCPAPLEWQENAEQAEREILSMLDSDGFLWTCPEDGVKASFQNLVLWPIGLNYNPVDRLGAVGGNQIDWKSRSRIGCYDPAPIVSDLLNTTYEKGLGKVTFSASDGRQVTYSCFDGGGLPRLSHIDAMHLKGIISRLRNQE